MHRMEVPETKGNDHNLVDRDDNSKERQYGQASPFATSGDKRFSWLEDKLYSSMKHVKIEKLRKSLRSEENMRALNDFFGNSETRCLLILGDGNHVYSVMPKQLPKGKGFFFLKNAAMEVTEDTNFVGGDLICGELIEEPLEHLKKVIQHVYMPLLSSIPQGMGSGSGGTGSAGGEASGVGDVASKEIMDKLHNFLANVSITLGQTQGKTCLPLPLIDERSSIAPSSTAGSGGVGASSSTTSKDKVHLLESAVITWTKQIKNVLKLDPENLLKSGENPTPEEEVMFWKHKAANLNSIFNQLQSDKIRRVLRVLEMSKSTYCSPFSKLCKEVFTMRLEANDNVRFLTALEPWFAKLNDRNTEFSSLVQLFKPMMHTLLLIWKNSGYYNTPARLVVIIREMCNAIIQQSCHFVSGEQIFELIESDQATQAVEKLKTTLKVCGTFKSTYFDYKATANAECPANPWRIQNNALFLRLDSFLERCHDILDLTQTIVQFTMLSKIEVGGTKGKALTTSVVQIYSDFRQAVEMFQHVGYDIMNVNAKEFDDDFYDFRCKIKELERRLGSILTQSFDDAATIHARFKLLDSFEGMLERPIIQDELEKKHVTLVQAYTADLKLVQETFSENRADPPIANNLPRASGAIAWCRGLLDRVTEPMEKLKQLNRSIMEREEAKEALKLHNSVLESLNAYCKNVAKEWATTVDDTAAAKLKLPLLRYRDIVPAKETADADAGDQTVRDDKIDEPKAEEYHSVVGADEEEDDRLDEDPNAHEANNQDGGGATAVPAPAFEATDDDVTSAVATAAEKAKASSVALEAAKVRERMGKHQQQVLDAGGYTYKLLVVNFDSQLIALLREVKYMLLHGLEVPGFALELNKKEKMFRNWRGKLQLCVNKYNSMMTSILPVECPLVRTQVEKIHSVVQNGLTMLTWKSHGIDGFIEKTEMAVAEAEAMLNALKSNMAEVEEILEGWSENSLLDRQNKPETVTEYNQMHATRIGGRYQQIVEGGKMIHKLLKDSNKTLRISAGHPEWRAYADFVNNVVVQGLTSVVQVSLEWLNSQVDTVIIEEKEKSPMLQVSINLNNDQVAFIPSVFDEDKNGVKASLRGWIEDTLKIGTLMKRLDLGDGSYVRELQNDIMVKSYMASIFDNIALNEAECRAFQKQYEKYAFLWNSDLQGIFREFIANATSVSPSGLRRIDLARFDEEMNRLNQVKEEVAALKTPTNIGWLKIDSTPIKENIVYWVQKWLHHYTGYLRDDVIMKLQNLRIFIIKTHRGLEREVQAGDTETLMSVMGNIRDVRWRMDDTQKMLSPLKEMVNLLKQHRVDIEDEILYGPLEDVKNEGGDDGVNLSMMHLLNNEEGEFDKQNPEVDVNGDDKELLLEFLDAASMKWDSLVNYTFRVKEQIMPLQNQEVEYINVALQKFTASVEDFRTLFKDEHKGAPFSFRGTPNEAYAQITRFNSLFEEKKACADELNSLEELFELQISKYRTLAQTELDLKVLKNLWDFKAMQIATYESWNTIQWKMIDTDELESVNSQLFKELKVLGAKDIICRSWKVYEDIEQACKDMAVVLPLLAELHSPAMRARHWKAIAAACKVNSIAWNLESFNFSSLLTLQLQRHANDVSEQVETAVKELKIEKKLEVIESRWETLRLDFVDAQGAPAPGSADGNGDEADQAARRAAVEAGTVFLPRPSDEVVENLETDQMELQSMIGMGKFVKYFKDRVSKWLHTLSDIESTLKDWLNVSKQWCSLESIYLGSADIRNRLPDDTKRFEAIHQEFKELEGHAFNESPLVVHRCTEEGLAPLLKRLLVDLAKCQKSLNEYLDTKKKVFPRFYFCSNVALLDILSNGDSPKRVVPYLADCYDSLSDLVFKDEAAEVPRFATAMVASDGESIPFPYAFEMKNSVEHWLNNLTDMQVLTLKTVLRSAIDAAVTWEHEKPRHEWLFDYPAQIVMQASQIFWTEETEAALEDLESGNEDAVKLYLEKCNERLNKLIGLVEGQLVSADRIKVISLITMDVHSRDVVQRLIHEKAEGPGSFLWQQQLRNYWKSINPNMDSDIRICDFKTKYSYEYVGNCGRLVITPLTDRCYITLTTAMRLMLGGAPAGPAGTGKTETTKDLARALALPCYVFNCSDQMNYQTLADIFKGLSQTGAWGCFDEFNRIPIEVLSVVATQVKTVLDAVVYFAEPANRPQALKDAAGEELAETPGTPPCKVGYFDFFGDELCLVPTTGFFITMNPGYAGRTELPENLKVLFRSCAMIRPDLALICENMLMSEGFQKARTLSVKFVTLYQLSSELLSPQAHYDWGLRAVKSVLRVAGMLKRTSPKMEEEPILMRALRDFNTPKIPAQDMDIFLRLVADLFPKYAETTPKVVNEELKNVCKEVCRAENPPLQADPGFVGKVIQYQELLDVRHSVMLVGCAGCGKSTIWKTLLACHNYMGKQRGCDKKVAIVETVNPKAVTSDELYGFMSLSKDWKDGVLSIIMRGMAKNYRDLGYHDYQTSKWVVLDGDIDAVWIESMNTVMDDNKVLTLVSNERIPLSDSMRMIFEINSLKNATPATVSRAGILYINETDIGWRPFVESWVAGLEPEHGLEQMLRLFDRFVEPVVEFVKRKKLMPLVHVYTISCVQSVCSLVKPQLAVWAALNPQAYDDKTASPAIMAAYSQLLEQMFAYACVWAFGSVLVDDKGNASRAAFSAAFCTTFPNLIPVSDGKSVFDYFVDTAAFAAAIVSDNNEPAAEDNWRLWADKVEDYVPTVIGGGSGQTPFGALYVETVDNVRITALVDTLVGQQKPVMLVGGAGTGKSVMVANWMREIVANDENMLSTLISMNYFTDAVAFQRQIEGAIDKRSGHRFGPVGNKNLVYFVDDVNLPYVEEYGTQNALSLLQQILSYGTFFDRADLGFKKEIVDVRFVSAMNPYAGSFKICERVQRHFTTVACAMPTDDSLNGIFTSVLDGHLQSFPASVEAMLGPLVQSTISLHNRVSEKFLPSAVKLVYNWNMREYANVFQGICRSDSAAITMPLDMCRLWVHECNRVFCDRLVDATDISRFQDILWDVSKTFAFDDTADLHAAPMIFTSFSRSGTDSVVDGYYRSADSMASLTKLLEGVLNEYNEAYAVMDLVLFKDAVKHITRISRIIQSNGGNAMLVGVGGSGKQSLSRLAAFMNGFQIKQMNVVADFNLQSLQELLQDLFKQTGIKGIPTAWIINDSQIVDERFLVYINDVLTNGWIPDLFPKEEFPSILDGLKNELRANGLSDTLQDKQVLFIRRVRQYLHVVLCMSPVGESLRVRTRRFPGLVNCTVVDWFHAWPEEALVSVALKFLKHVEFNSQETRENVAYHMATVHLEVGNRSADYLNAAHRYNYVTPKSFLEFILFYKKLLNEQREQATAQVERLQNGLGVLKNTSIKVADLQVDLKLTLANVAEKKEASSKLMEQIGVQRADAEQKQAAAAREQARAEEASAVANEIQESANKELAEATPAMEAAAAAVDCLDKQALTELKSMSKPPAGVNEVTKACLMMIEGEFKNFKWDRAKKMMNNVDAFLNSLKKYDAENMEDTLIAKLALILEGKDFSYEVMLKKSFAAANLCNWVCNIYKYNRIYVKVKPLMDKLEAAQRDKSEAENELADVQRVVHEVEKRLDDLKKTFMQATQEKMAVEELAEQCQNKLDLANRLVGGLSSENERWAVEVDRLRKEEEQLIGNVLISSAFVGYIGGFDADFRRKLWKEEWVCDLRERELPCASDDIIEPLALLSTDTANIQMMDEGLPADRISLENGAIISSCTRWPLIIDPQEQGFRWLKKRYTRTVTKAVAPRSVGTPVTAFEKTGSTRSILSTESSTAPSASDALDAKPAMTEVLTETVLPLSTQLTKSGWMDEVTRAIEQGEVLLIENIGEDIDATLDPVLSRAIIRKGKNTFLNFAGKELEYDERFRLFMFTKLSNPHFKPEVQAQCTLINFIATEKGLEDQLLVRVVQAERPDKEEEQQQLQSDFNHFKVQLTSLEDALLHKLANAPEDILSDVKLIESLEATKEEAEKINLAVTAGQKVLEEIAKIRDTYRPVAAEASMLYFMLTRLSSVNHMYQYSLESFVQFFNKSIRLSPPGTVNLQELHNTRMNSANSLVQNEEADGTANAEAAAMAIIATDPKVVAQRVCNLRNTLRFTIFQFVARGLFDTHKQLFLAQLTFNLMQRGQLDSSSDWDDTAFDFLVRMPPPEIPVENPLPEWLPDASWTAIQALSELEGFFNLPNDLVEAAPRFRDWYGSPAPENEKLPLDWAHLDRAPFMKLLVIRCFHPDRMTSAVNNFVRKCLPNGSVFSDCDSELNSFDLLKDVFGDASNSVPLYFILSPGTDVMADIDRLAMSEGFIKGKSFFNVSLGQGQDRVAEELLELAHKEGFWVVLNNLHLMPKWLVQLEKLLDQFKEQGSHSNFRLFLSSDPSTDIPIGLLSRCIKLTNEAPSGLKANLKRAFLSFPRGYIEESDPRTKAVLFGLSYFHCTMTERKRYGPIGFNMQYPFSMGDLRDSAVCLNNYMDSNTSADTPWADLRYLFGEIIYGGHIVNDFDRLLANTMLEHLMKDELMDEMELFPFVDTPSSANGELSGVGGEAGQASFKCPPPTTVERYLDHIDDCLKVDTPLAYGLHSNAEIGFKTTQGNQLFSMLDGLRSRNANGADGGESTPLLTAENLTGEILDRFGDLLDVEGVFEALSDGRNPFQVVFLQEAEALNALLVEMRRLLIELTQGFAGELTVSDEMEQLMEALHTGAVPTTWAKLAWPSTRGLASWLNDLAARLTQIQTWVTAPLDMPRATWIAGLVFPQSFLTAIKQTFSQRTSTELDALTIATDVPKKSFDELLEAGHPRDGCYVHGFYLEGARWNTSDGSLEAARPKELFFSMPIILCKAIRADKITESGKFYHCPVYKTTERGHTYVFSAQVRTKVIAAKWILAGAALVLDIGL